ncbi:MAG: RNA polymerase sigma factor [Spirochaetales bacterium]|nr:MAG: RNA polymerase sigma factor [Spirochaetales bacterium]
MSREESTLEFSQLYENTFRLIYTVAYRITGKVESAEELTQEAFIKLYERFSQFEDANQAKYWLIRVVKNLAFNHEKRKGTEIRAYTKFLNNSRESEDSSENLLLRKEASEAVRVTLNRLPEKLRAPLVLKEYGELSYKEIAEILGISEGNVKVRVFRAREVLSNLMREDNHVS